MPNATARPKSGKPKSKSLYSVHPGVAMVQKWIAQVPEKTGRSLEQWLRFIKKEGPTDENARREWLKTKHKLGTNTAGWLAERASADPNKGFAEEDPQEYLRMADKYVDDMFSGGGGGGKAALRPIYDALLKLGLSIGPESKACPCQTIVPLYRNHVFAQIKPTTNTRIDLGFALGPMIKQGKKISARLQDTGGFAKKDRITHRTPITSLKEIDDDVKKWLKIAYDLDAKD